MERIKASLSWNDALNILKERYKREYNVSDLSFNYYDEEVTEFCDDHDGLPPEKVTYVGRYFLIHFTKNAGNISIPCDINKRGYEINDDLNDEMSKILELSGCELDKLIIWGCAFDFKIEYSFHLKNNDIQKHLKRKC